MAVSRLAGLPEGVTQGACWKETGCGGTKGEVVGGGRAGGAP